MPTLVGTTIPTVSPVPPTAAVCSPPAQLALPANFPAEVVIPPDLVIYSIQTAPHLQVIGRVPPPIDTASSEAPFGIAAFAVTSRMREKGWTTGPNVRAEGADYTITAPDGRVLHFNALPKAECSGAVQLTYDLQWVTP